MRSANQVAKCLVCFAPVKIQDQYQGDHENSYLQLLTKQLNVIFVLENIFELKPYQLQIYLRQCGNPREWVSFCEKCEQDICNIREIFLRLHDVKRKFEKAKWEIQDKVRVQEEERTTTGPKIGVAGVFYDCRNIFLRNRVLRSSPQIQNPFKHGDLRATELALKIDVGLGNPSFETNEPNFDAPEEDCPEDYLVHDHDTFEDLNSHSSSIEDSIETETASQLQSPRTNSKIKRKKSTPFKSSSEFQCDDDELKSLPKTSKKRKVPTSTDPQLKEKKKKHPNQKLICPACRTSVRRGSTMGDRFVLFSEHFQACVTSSSATNILLKCSLCHKWSCSSLNNGAKEFMEHFVQCMDHHDHNESMQMIPIPWRHSVFKCNLCEGSKESCYLPFPDYTMHIYRYHQHKYGCSQCPYRAQISTTISLKHWTRCHKNLLETPKNERFMTIPEGDEIPLPHIPWWCPAPGCLEEFSNEASRDLHLSNCIEYESEELKRTFKCSYCDQGYFSEEELQMHRVSVHGRWTAEAPKCEECNLQFNNRKALQVHRRKVHQLNLFKCGTCGAEFDNNDRLHGHMRLQHGDKEDLQDYTCDICHKIFSHKFKLRRYLVDVHSVLQCQDCGIELKDKKALESHTKSEHQPTVTIRIAKHQRPKNKTLSDGKIFCCTWDSCGKTYSSSTALYIHVKYSHREKQDHICHVCGKSCRTPTLLKTHIKHMHEKCMSFHCDVEGCGRDFPSERELSRHQASRHAIGFKCDVEGCSRVFSKENLLEDHRKYKHEGVEKPRPYSCLFCGKGFVEKAKVKRHELSMHINKDSRPFKCPLQNCGKGFPTKAHCQYHLKNTHKIENPRNLE